MLRTIIKWKHLRATFLDLLADIGNVIIFHIFTNSDTFLLLRWIASRIICRYPYTKEMQFICETKFPSLKRILFFFSQGNTLSLLPGLLFVTLTHPCQGRISDQDIKNTTAIYNFICFLSCSNTALTTACLNSL